MIKTLLATTATLFFALTAHAMPHPLKVVPLGNPNAPVKGTFYRNLTAEPENLNPLNSSEVVSTSVQEYVVEGLLYLNVETNEWEPELAENYEASKDGLTYTFWLRKDAKWDDGTPVTAEDVKFSFDLVKDPAFKASARLPYYDNIDKVEVVDPLTVKFTMKRKYFKNLDVLASWGFTPIVSKAVYADPKKKLPVVLRGSGAYKVESYNRGKNITLVRNKLWWGEKVDNHRTMAKFDKIVFRFIKEETLEIEMAKKGEIQFIKDVSAEVFEKKAVGAPFGTDVKKVQVENKRPKPWGFVAWNLRNPMFQDKNVRVALASLLNRKLLMEKFLFGKAEMAVGPYNYNSPYTPADIKPILFNPDKAKELLGKAGWKDEDKNSVLEKTIDGKKVEFRFTLLLANRDVEKYFTIYKEDLKKAGIDMQIKLVEWNTFSKLLDEQKFEAVTLSWGGGSPEDDPKQIWHSESAIPGGSNFVGYKNPEVDKLIDAARQELDAGKRKVMWQKFSRLVAEDAPYAFLFNRKYDLYIVSKKIAAEKPTYTYDIGYPYWYSAE
jgi:microcin C transport system substrate-binding protein